MVSTRSFPPSSNPSGDRCLHHQVINGLERLRRQSRKAALKRIMLGHARAAKIGELTQRQPIGDPFSQLAIIPVLDPHEDQRVQDLPWCQSAATAAGLLQAGGEIAPDAFHHVVLVVEKIAEIAATSLVRAARPLAPAAPIPNRQS